METLRSAATLRRRAFSSADTLIESTSFMISKVSCLCQKSTTAKIPCIRRFRSLPRSTTGVPPVSAGLTGGTRGTPVLLSKHHSALDRLGITLEPVPGMDRSLIEDLIASNKPFRVETASGRAFEVPHRDFVSFSRNKTALFISYDENGEEHFAIVPLLTVTAATARASG